jgi:diguanylate cyclase (GGDEF)-like protein/PAS domain S-box-containing protein
VAVAVFASYGALRVSAGIRKAVHPAWRRALLAAGAVSLGGGIWAVHFIGMLAFSVPGDVRFDLPATFAPVLPGLLAGGVAVHVLSRTSAGWGALAAGATVLGLGTGLMHQMGMAALRMNAVPHQDPSLFALSVLVVIVLAGIALGVPVLARERLAKGGGLAGLGAATVMGSALSGIHYTTMAVTSFLCADGPVIPGDGVNSGVLATVIAAAAGLVVSAAMFGSMARRTRDLAFTADTANERLRQISAAFDTIVESVMIADPHGAIMSVNPAFTRITGYNEAEVKGRNPRLLRSGRHDHAWYARMWEDINTCGHWQGEIWNRRKSGEIYPQWLTISAIKNEKGDTRSYVAVGSDISSIRQKQEELNRSLHHNQTILDSAGEGILGIGAQGEVVFVNPAAEAMLGWSPAELIGRNAHRSIHHTRADGAVCASATCPVSAVLGDGKARKVGDDYFWRKDGKGFAVDYTVAPVAVSGQVTGAVIVFRDITERQCNESQMRLAARVFESSPDGIVITDRRHKILSVNQAFLTEFHTSLDDVRGHRPDILFAGTMNRTHLRQALRALACHGSWEAELVGQRQNGEIFPASVKISADRDPAGQVSHYVAIISDMSEATSAQDRIDYLSRYDSLTALPNLRTLRDYFEVAQGSAAHSGRSMALIQCNLDNFKDVNDTLGRALGDELLREVAKRLRGCVAIGTGDVICRNGGDEFLVLLIDAPNEDAVQASIYAMRAVMSVPTELDHFPVTVTASFGVSCYPADGDDFDTLFQKADLAVNDAKTAGRNTVRFFAGTMINVATERLIMKYDLRTAIERDEFIIHYQPLIDLDSGRITGAEALLRWQSPKHGLVPPTRFIPIAEESGLIVPIGQWVLRQVCQQGRIWREAGFPDLRLAVNISVIQLHNPNFVETVRQLVEESGMPPEWLELELTESVLISDVDQTLERIGQLKQLGVRLAIDDFGTGYSCLSYLHKLKTDKLKIDRSFVLGLTINPESDAIVTTILQMAATMNMTTLAEGVETAAQADFLKDKKCGECQGYLFGRPVSAEEFSRQVQASLEKPAQVLELSNA